MNRAVWATIALLAVAAVAILNAGRVGFIPLLYAWPLLVLLAAVPGFIHLVWRHRRQREDSLLQGEVAWRRRIEVDALRTGNAAVQERLAQASRAPSAKELQDAEDLAR